MEIERAIIYRFEQLSQVLHKLKPEEYTAKPLLLNGASIGEHCRHLLEMFICLEEGYEKGVVNYENRRRDKVLEQNKTAAMDCMKTLLQQISKKQKKLVLHASYGPDNNMIEEFPTSYYRELAYTHEHAVHHMALIRIGLNLVAPALQVPQNFGTATSTVKHKKLCAQ